MRILEINKFNFAKGGADKFFLDICKLFESCGHEVAVFSMKHSKNLPSPFEKYFVSTAGYTSEYAFWQKIKGAFRMFYSMEAKRKINKILDDFNPDIVHIHNIYHQLSPCILFEIKKRKIPIIMTVHDYKLINPNYNLFSRGEFYDGCRNGKFYECFFDKCVKDSYAKSFLAMLEAYWHDFFGTYRKNIDLYLAPSEFVKNILAERGIDEKKIKVLPHFSAASIQKEINKNDKERYALYFGRISKEKGVDFLIETFKKLNGVRLYLAGSLEDGFVLEKNKNIKYLGYFNGSQLKDYIQKSLFVVSGSRLPETFGLITLEANSFGKPFVGFKTGAYSEIIENRVNGYLADSEEELKKAMENISNNKMVFSEKVIQDYARKKYSRKEYYIKIMEVFNKTIDSFK